MITRHVTPGEFRLRLSEFLTGGACDTFTGHYRRLYDDAFVLVQEDDELREAKEELAEVKSALQDANLDLAEARAEIEKLKAKRKVKE